MKRFLLPLMLAVSLLLTGCGWMDGSYLSVTPHQQQRQNSQTEVISASNYSELIQAMKMIIEAGTEIAAINVSDYPATALDGGVEIASGQGMT